MSAEPIRIRIDRDEHEVVWRCPLGRQLLALAGKIPKEHRLYYKSVGGVRREIGANERISLRHMVLGRFETEPRQVQQG